MESDRDWIEIDRNLGSEILGQVLDLIGLDLLSLGPDWSVPG